MRAYKTTDRLQARQSKGENKTKMSKFSYHGIRYRMQLAGRQSQSCFFSFQGRALRSRPWSFIRILIHTLLAQRIHNLFWHIILVMLGENFAGREHPIRKTTHGDHSLFFTK